MARHLLSRGGWPIAALAFGLLSCRHEDHVPTGASASAAPADSARAFVEGARALHFDAELKRARERWRSLPALGDCTHILREKSDIELCQAATAALGAIEQAADAAPERTLPVLSDGALALARLSQRVRYLSLSELSPKRDAGAPPAASGAASASARPREPNPSKRAFRDAFELSDSPIAQLMGNTVHLERDVIRNLGAYLEYAELPVRRSAFDTVKRLRETRPQWALLDHLLREAALLESDPNLKRALKEASASGLPNSKQPGQSPDSK